MKSIYIGLSVLLIGLIALTAGPWLLLYIGISSTEDPPKLTYTYGEFPFSLKYEINGQIKTVEDTVIVEFDGFGLSEGSGGKYIQWKQTLTSGNEEIILFNDEQEVSLIFAVRGRNYRLEDKTYNEDTLTPPSVIKQEGNITFHSPIYDYELLTEYKIKLIKFEYGESIKK